MKHLRKIFLFQLSSWACLLLFSNHSLAQHKSLALKKADELYRKASKLSDREEDSLALASYLEARSIYLEQAYRGPELVGTCVGMGIIYQIQGKQEQAMEAYRESILYQRKIHPVIDSSYFIPYIYLGNSFIGLNQFDSASFYLGKAESLLAQYPELPEAIRLYNSKGYLFYLFGNYEQSINYFEKSLATLNYDGKLSDQTDEYKVQRYVMYNNNIAGSLRKLGYPQKALQKAKSLTKYNVPKMSNMLYQHIASTYLQIEHYDSAKIYLDKIKANEHLSDTKLHPVTERIDYYISLGLVYSKTDKLPEALSCFDKAKGLVTQNFSQKNADLAIAYQGKGNVYDSQKNIWKACVIISLLFGPCITLLTRPTFIKILPTLLIWFPLCLLLRSY
ncbi:hypothetical protein BH24BAC1_BH24BAC1_31190 [soil metagenome]